MKNCLQCNAELTHVEGRKQKSFCNVNCRNKYFYAQRKILVELGKSAGAMNKETQEFVDKYAIVKTEPVIHEFVSDKQVKIPRTLDQLKALCPYEKGTDEYRVWVATERQKYNI